MKKMLIKRKLNPIVEDHFFRRKAIIILGARQVGKSTLMKHVTEKIDQPLLDLNCDDPEVRDILTNINSANLKLLIGNFKVITIDEAQRVENVGLVLKRMVDNYPDIQVVASGSSSLRLRESINEPLTGRKYEYTMFPISTAELYDTYGLLKTRQLLDSRLIYGSYPDVLTHQEEAKDLLRTLADSYLYKDILELDEVRKPVVLQKILIALALQLGSEVAYNEVARTVGSDPKTVERYIDLLEKCFVVYSLPALSRNMRNELKKTRKIFFYDNGIRNAILQNYAPISLRNDIGALWENFFITERIKYNAYLGRHVNYYFWRTTNQQEIDLVEESDGEFSIFEMKWNPSKASTKFPQSFIDNYSPKECIVVTPDNYLDFLL
ncbi:MAG: ATP-binding protein [Muribaculaceae bacterium]|nr:ATP-binding protein [Muribaculaceae bacterium]